MNEFNIYSPDLNSKPVRIISFADYHSAMLLSERNVKYDVLRKLKNNEGKYFEEIQNIISSTNNMNFETLISVIQLSLSVNFFKKKYNVSKEEIYSEQRNLKNDLFWYCVVKSVKTLKYKTHQEFINSFELNNFFFSLNKNFKELNHNYFRFISLEDRSHITNKLRRAIILLDLIITRKTSIIEDNISNESSFDQLILYYEGIVREVNSPSRNSYDNDKLVKDLNPLGELINNTWELIDTENIELIDLLPPPIFKYEFYSNNIPLSKISSGQFQKIGLLSSIVYHLKNLDSIQERPNFNSYKQVLIVLDEIELYFHPEQQREFIYDLVRLLKLNKFKQIENINIFFITHSPFILSDIPSQNVLKLDKGKPVDNDDVNSFGANIHDLLADEFFLDNGFMGKFAKKKINDLLKYLTYDENKKNANENENPEIKWNPILVEEFIKIIGEPLLKYDLKELYLSKFYNEKKIDDEIERLQELKRLKSNDIN